MMIPCSSAIPRYPRPVYARRIAVGGDRRFQAFGFVEGDGRLDIPAGEGGRSVLAGRRDGLGDGIGGCRRGDRRGSRRSRARPAVAAGEQQARPEGGGGEEGAEAPVLVVGSVIHFRDPPFVGSGFPAPDGRKRESGAAGSSGILMCRVPKGGRRGQKSKSRVVLDDQRPPHHRRDRDPGVRVEAVEVRGVAQVLTLTVNLGLIAGKRQGREGEGSRVAS